MITIDNKKQCCKCKEWKPATNGFFCNHKTGPLGLRSNCKQCDSKWCEVNQGGAEHGRNMITIDNKKQCSKCKEWQPATNEFFSNYKSGVLGLNSQCKQCSRKISRKWYEANPERVKETSRKWQKANPEKAKEKKRKWRNANRERVRENNRKWCEANLERHKENCRRWREANRERENETARKWRKANPERAKEADRKWYEANKERKKESGRKWRRENPGKVVAKFQRRRALKANAAGTATAEQIKARFQYHGNRCYYCGDNKQGLQIEHRIPLSRGGSNWPANLVPSCPSCNLSKHTKTEKEFLQIISERGDNEKP